LPGEIRQDKGELRMGDKNKKKQGFWRLRATQEEIAKATKQVEERNTPQSLRPEGLRMGKRKSRLGFRKQVQIKNQVLKNKKKETRGEDSEKTGVENTTPVNPEVTPDVSKKTKVENTAKEKVLSKHLKKQGVSKYVVPHPFSDALYGQDWEAFTKDIEKAGKTVLKVNKGAANIIGDVEKSINPGTQMAEYFKWYFNKYGVWPFSRGK